MLTLRQFLTWSLLHVQIREELVYHNIRLYPFDTDENDTEELQLNESIRVCHFWAVCFALACLNVSRS